jgi:hypothetical protein
VPDPSIEGAARGTAGSIADLSQDARADVEKWNHRIWRRVAILSICGLCLLGAVVGFQTNQVAQIRETQVANASLSLEVAREDVCVALTTNNAIHDVILALVDKDPNKADYKALTTCKVIKVSQSTR